MEENDTELMVCRAAFSINRFRFLLLALRFDNINTRAARAQNDKLAPIREVYQSLNQNYHDCYSFSEFMTVDKNSVGVADLSCTCPTNRQSTVQSFMLCVMLGRSMSGTLKSTVELSHEVLMLFQIRRRML